MKLEALNSILYSDTQIPDVFITEYMPSADGDSVRVYLYCMFMSKYNGRIELDDIAKKLDLDTERVRSILLYWESLEVIKRNQQNAIVLSDLKEKEINRVFRYRSTSDPKDALAASKRNKDRNTTISAINKTFFQGLMSPSWYTDIDSWFDRYAFDSDVMYMLFNHCQKCGSLQRNYIQKVAESWFTKGIRNSIQLDVYLEQVAASREIKSNIAKKLGFSRKLTSYEDELVNKWYISYGFTFDIIELALRKTITKANPNLKYVDAIITKWYEAGLKTLEQIVAYEETQKEASKKSRAQSDKVPAMVQEPIPAYKNYEQRKYGVDYDDSLFDNFKIGKKMGDNKDE